MNNNSVTVDGFRVEGFCREQSFYVLFTDQDMEDLA